MDLSNTLDSFLVCSCKARAENASFAGLAAVARLQESVRANIYGKNLTLR
jgi:hypothetical protein